MLQCISSVFIVYRHKTLTGSPDPTHANGMDKPCTDLKLTKQKCNFLKAHVLYIGHYISGQGLEHIPEK